MKSLETQRYCLSYTEYQRFVTRQVKVGDLTIGGHAPIVVQSMTTTDTLDTMGTVAQSIRMIEAGCELVRITAPSMREAENLRTIKEELRIRGYKAPLVADIHFTPNAAELAARIVEKVRVNPGNYADKKKFEQIDFSDAAYEAELERIRKRFTPLVKICKEYGTAMRIGTNHGSLSDRIMSRFGDTPLGMVASAMEFVNICRDEDFHEIVLSMKASNPQVMVQAYRLLVQQMMEAGMNYPLHLGVTEAGDGEDGRIKSSVGIGALLEDGLGDTIRVSLTEEPEYEIPVARMLAERYTARKATPPIPPMTLYPTDPFSYHRRPTQSTLNIGGGQVPVVIATPGSRRELTQASLFSFGYNYSKSLDKWHIADAAADYVWLGNRTIDFALPGTLGVIQDYTTWEQKKPRHYPLVDATAFNLMETLPDTLLFVKCALEDFTVSLSSRIKSHQKVVVVLTTENSHGMAEQRRAFAALQDIAPEVPVVIHRQYTDTIEEPVRMYSATDMGALLLDGFGDGVWIDAPNVAPAFVNQTAFGILQATRTRISKTEYISCPSCGRTLFDLQEVTAKIRARTHHLKGVKIGIMGCIVNGPGEMADADYGYVGTGVGKISLYKSKEVVKRALPEEEAVDALIELIKSNGDWVDPPELNS